MAIHEALQQLLKKVSGEWFFKSPSICDEIEEFAAKRQLQNNVNDLPHFTVVLCIVANAVFDLIDNIMVLQVLHGLHLGDNQLLQRLVRVVVDYFNSVLLASCPVSTQFHLAASSLADGPEYFVISNISWH